MPLPAIATAALTGFASTAASGLAAKLFGGKKKKQKTSSTIDYVKLRKSAEKAGFNPLTALRAGGGAGFQTTHHPVLSSGNVFGQALASGLQAGVDAAVNYDPLAEERAQIEQDLLKAQLANVQANTAHINRLDPLVATGPVTKKQTGYTSMHVGTSGKHDRPIQDEPEISYPVSSRVVAGDTTMYGPNPEAFEVGANELIGAGMIYGPQWLWHKATKEWLPALWRARSKEGRAAYFEKYSG